MGRKMGRLPPLSMSALIKRAHSERNLERVADEFRESVRAEPKLHVW